MVVDASPDECYSGTSPWEAMKAGFSSQDMTFTVFVAVLVLAPLPLGSFRPWSGALAATLLGLIATAWALVTLRAPETPGVSARVLALPLALYGAALIWGLVQILPLAPEGWDHPIWAQAEAALGPLPRRISMAPAAGRDALAQLLADGLAFLLAVQMGRSPRRAARLVEALALASGAIALYGLVVYFSGSETIFWLEKWAYRGDLTAVLVNRNHYATLAGLGLLCSVSASLARWEQRGGRECLRGLLGGKDRLTAGLLASGGLTALALPFTHSRAGMAVAVLGLCLLLVLSQQRNWKRLAILLGLTCGAALIAVLEMDERLTELGADVPQRMRVWQLSWELLAERPWLGQGLGAFPDAFQAIRPGSITQIWTQAHNSWLELMVELGAPAACSLFLAAGWAWRRCLVAAVRRHRNRDLPALGAAAGLLVGAHALVDFSPQIPAVAYVLAAMMGVGVAQSWSSRMGSVVE